MISSYVYDYGRTAFMDLTNSKFITIIALHNKNMVNYITKTIQKLLFLSFQHHC